MLVQASRIRYFSTLPMATDVSRHRMIEQLMRNNAIQAHACRRHHCLATTGNLYVGDGSSWSDPDASHEDGSDFTFDTHNKRLGIGVGYSPLEALHVQGNIKATGSLVGSSGTVTYSQVRSRHGSGGPTCEEMTKRPT